MKAKFKKLPLIVAISCSTTTYAAFNDPGTDYSNVESKSYVWNEALEPIELVNSILCFAGQMQANSFVNEDPYIVLADEAACFDEEESNEGGQSSAASNAPSFLEVIVDSDRDTETSPLEVAMWILDMPAGDSEQTIKFKAEISEGASQANPFGRFTFNFDFFSSNDLNNSTGGGEVKTINDIDGKIGFTLFESNQEGAFSFSQSASVVMSEDRSNGIALTASSFGGFGGQAYALAFNETNVKIQSADSFDDLPYKNGNQNGVCLNRTNFDDTVYRYGLFNATTGAEVEINSGFPFRYDVDNDSVNDGFGHVGYWGVWTEEEGVLENGDVITKENFNGGQAEQFTIISAPGRLIKYSVDQLLLSDARGINLNYWNDAAIQAGYNEWIVNYLTVADDSVGQDGFYITGGRTWGEGGPEITQVTPTLINLSANEPINFWSEQLGGEIKYIGGANSLTFFSESFINGSETGSGEILETNSVTLKCFDRCLVGTLQSADIQNFDGTGSPYEDMVANVASALDYNFSASGASALTLVRDSNSEPVVFSESLSQSDLDNSPHGWGVRSGPMVTADVAATLTNPWDIYDPSLVTEFYVWETGLQQWNRLTTVQDENGDIVTFDKPIQFAYNHSDANDRSGDAGAYDGQLFMLNYGGNGDLWGIPFVNRATSVSAALALDGGEDDGGRYEPAFNIADGVVMGPSNDYVIKALEVEQKMSLDPGSCSDLTLTDPEVDVPTETEGSADIGDVPEVSDAPKVIAGEIVGD